MHNSEFEKQVQKKMEELRLTPGEAVWDKVEASLQKEKKRRWLIWLLLIAAFATGGGLLWNQKQNDKVTNVQQPAKHDSSNNNKLTQMAIGQQEPAKIPAKLADSTSKQFAGVLSIKDVPLNLSKIQSTPSVETKLLAGKIDEGTNSAGKPVAPLKRALKSPLRVSVKIKPGGGIENLEPINAQTSVLESDNVKLIVTAAVPPLSSGDTVRISKVQDEEKIIIKKIPAVIEKKDGSPKSPTVKKPEKNKKPSWEPSVLFGAGISNTADNLFGQEEKSVAFGNTTTTPPIYVSAATPSTGLSLKVAFHLEKKVSAKWSLRSGIDYNYLSNTLQVAKKIDSVGIGSSTARGYSYVAGTGVKYRNQFHLLSIPVSLQYRFSKNEEKYFFLEAGTSVSYLINSNSLLLNKSSGSYFNNKEIFNRWLLIAETGGGFAFAQHSKLPLSIGTRFNYSLNSVFKTKYGQQHLSNALLYIRLGLKK